MVELDDDPEVTYWKELGFKVRRDEDGGLIAENKWGFLREALNAQSGAKRPVILTDRGKKNRVTYPGKGATDEQ